MLVRLFETHASLDLPNLMQNEDGSPDSETRYYNLDSMFCSRLSLEHFN
jgi:hypothetical protein